MSQRWRGRRQHHPQWDPQQGPQAAKHHARKYDNERCQTHHVPAPERVGDDQEPLGLPGRQSCLPVFMDLKDAMIAAGSIRMR